MWKYRVVRHTESGSEEFHICEVLFGDNGEVLSISDSIHPFGNSVDELRTDIQRMFAALQHPIVDDSATMEECVQKEEQPKEIDVSCFKDGEIE